MDIGQPEGCHTSATVDKNKGVLMLRQWKIRHERQLSP